MHRRLVSVDWSSIVKRREAGGDKEGMTANQKGYPASKDACCKDAVTGRSRAGFSEGERERANCVICW